MSHNHPAFSCFRDRLTLKLADSTKFLELNRPGFDILSSLAVLFGLPVRRGFLIQDVFPGSPAHLAGLRAGSRAIVLGENLYVIGGDVVTYINGKDVSALSQIHESDFGISAWAVRDTDHSQRGADDGTRFASRTNARAMEMTSKGRGL